MQFGALHHSSGPPQDGLLEELRRSLKDLEPLCLPHAKPVGERLLWFRRSEHRAVQSVRVARGLEGVLQEWGSERTYAFGPKVNIAAKLPDKAPLNPIILRIREYQPKTDPQSVAAAKVRTATFAPTRELRRDILAFLSNSGLLERVEPDNSRNNGAPLDSSHVRRIKCRVRWDSSQYPTAQTASFSIMMEMPPVKYNSQILSLTVDYNGKLSRSVMVGNLSQGGYEGDGDQPVLLYPDDLRKLLPIIRSMKGLPLMEENSFYLGCWVRQRGADS